MSFVEWATRPEQMKAGRDLWWHELMADASRCCEPVENG